MPYIVTTRIPAIADSSMVDPARVSRRAVGTLEEARGVIKGRALPEDPALSEGAAAEAIAAGLSEQGGTVTLLDGTVIEVERSDEPIRNARVAVAMGDEQTTREICAELAGMGFRNVLLLWSERVPEHVQPDYIARCHSDPDRILAEAIAAYNAAQEVTS